jgi:arylsulfatase A-like enzyme
MLVRPHRLRSRRAASALLGLVLLTGCAEPPEPGTRIVVLTLDTLRHDAFAPTDGETAMPRTRAFAARGLRYERFYTASSSTQPTHATLFTGLHPWQHGVTRNGQVLGEEATTLAETLRAAGWSTEAVVASFPVHEKFGFAQGFDRYDDDFSFERKPMPETWIGNETVGSYFFSIADDVTERALGALDRLEGPRQFLWVHYFDPHSPYGDLEELPVGLRRLRSMSRGDDAELPETLARARELYRSDVGRMDAQLARLFAALEADAEHLETHVLVTSDHGESFGEDGSFGHDSRLTPEQIHVPFFVVSPRLSPGDVGAVRRDVAGTIDLFATVLALAGLASPTGQGRDLTAPAEGDGIAYGLRRYDPGAAGPRFFAVSGRRHLAGDASTLCEGDRPEETVPEEDGRDVRELFRAFAAELETTTTRSLEDEETRRTLRAMGYGG